MNLRRHLEQRLSAALREAAGLPDAPAMVAQASRPEFGDYQANGVMGAAKALRTHPRQLAAAVADAARAELADAADTVEVAGPGFINIRLKENWLARQLAGRADDERLGAEPPEKPQTVVVDYSAPNLAKEMHVGHLRSTIIGDALARTLDFLGHRAVRQNHVGDWGTQFGMLVAFLKEQLLRDPTYAQADTDLADLESFYQQAKARFDADPGFADAAREEVVLLHSGDNISRDYWTRWLQVSLTDCERVYSRLGVTLTEKDVRGESFYNDDLPKVVAALEAKGLLTESQGAQCVFLDEFKDADGNILPVIVRKSDGGYLYATTDLAAIRFRCGKGQADGVVDWSAERILYVIDSRQSLHLRQVFAVARRAGFAPPEVSLEHVGFGTMQGADGRPFRTRDGGTVKLMDLLDQAEERARRLVEEKNPGLTDADKDRIGRIVGIGAVKYADLSQNRASDYVFSFDKMLSLDGNTAPYMQYAYARICSIFRKDPASRERERAGEDVSMTLDAPAERALALKLLQFPETVQAVADECLPNLLCGYLYDLATAFSSFYETCPVLKADAATRAARLALCDRTARTIRTGLGLLGIETVEQM